MKRLFLLCIASMGCVLLGYSQVSLRGRVTNSNGEPLIGASVYLTQTDYGTATNLAGEYIIEEIKEGGYKLTVSYIGYVEHSQVIDLYTDKSIDITLEDRDYVAEETVVSAVRAGEKTPTTHSFVAEEEIKKNNLGKDVPYLLSMQPSVVVSSDGGTGIGYTSMRIRGVDSRQINVTINGVPLNDAESHGVFWVDIPDIAGSTEGIQIQRGVGSSTNGSGAFGGSINLGTNNISMTPYAELNSSAGSFNTFKNSVGAGTGLINDHWFLEGKYSLITSDGYRDRAWSDLKSYFVQGGYYSENTIIKALAFGGREETYQAWYSVTEEEMEMYGRTFNPAGIIYNNDWSIKGYYDNFIDHYDQDHFQLHWVQEINSNLTFNTALHYTYGRGYYEEYMQEEFLMYYPMEFYDLEPLYFGYDSTEVDPGEYEYFYHDSVTYSDVIRRLWLDNDYYGATWSLKYANNRLEAILGGAYSLYTDAKHFGEIVWARYASNSLPGHEFYNNESEKSDFNSFLKVTYDIIPGLNVYADFQVRNINYTADGLDREWTDGDRIIDIDKAYTFLNPKGGLMYQIDDAMSVYTSYALAHREPNRSDFLDAPGNIEPKPEQLQNLEIGYKANFDQTAVEIVGYNMQYYNQLVMTGKLNDVGTPIRKNVGESYRRGIEIIASHKPLSFLEAGASVTLSTNKTSYKEFLSGDSTFVDHKDMTLSYSPSVIGSAQVIFTPFENLQAGFYLKHVGSQYVDNTESEELQLPAYTLLDFKMNYSIAWNKAGIIDLFFNVHNLTDEQYSSYGAVHWTGSLGYFPQAGINYLCGASLKF